MNKLQGKRPYQCWNLHCDLFCGDDGDCHAGILSPIFSSASDRAGSADWRNRNDAVLF